MLNHPKMYILMNISLMRATLPLFDRHMHLKCSQFQRWSNILLYKMPSIRPSGQFDDRGMCFVFWHLQIMLLRYINAENAIYSKLLIPIGKRNITDDLEWHLIFVYSLIDAIKSRERKIKWLSSKIAWIITDKIFINYSALFSSPNRL